MINPAFVSSILLTKPFRKTNVNIEKSEIKHIWVDFSKAPKNVLN